MKYKSRTGKNLSDQNILSDLGQTGKGLLQNSPSSTGNFFSALFQYFIGAMAFLSRSFIRANLGERTFGVLTLISIIFFVGLIKVFPSAYDATYDATSLKDTGGLFFDILIFFFTFFYPLYILLFGKFIGLDANSYFDKIDFTISTPLMWFVGIILIITLGQIAEVYSRRSQKIVVHSFYRGDSLLFGWLEDRSILGLKFTKLRIWMFVEPIFVLVVAFTLEQVFNYNDVALLLKVSAVCLFIEEFRVYQENRRFELDMLDGQLDAAYASQLQKEYEEGLEEAKTKSPKAFRSTFGLSQNAHREKKGSTAPFRAKIH